ncbi:MAG: condensation domain-containing protein, partial [Acidobacteriota bacterium]
MKRHQTLSLTLPIEMPPFTHSQMPILIAQRLAPSNPSYNMAFSMVFAAKLCPETFQAAWRRVIEANASLRTVVDGSQGIGSPVLRPVSDYETQVFDLEDSPNPESEFQRWSEERARSPLPLDRPLVESALFDFGDGRTAWYLNQHHLLCDAWSTALLYRQVGEEYAALVDETSRPTPLVDYTLVTQNLLAKSRPKARRVAQEHWQERIQGHRLVSLYGRPCTATGGGCTRLSLSLDAKASTALARLASEKGFVSLSGDLSLFAVFATLITSWISRISGLTQISIDAPAGGRTTPESKRAL